MADKLNSILPKDREQTLTMRERMEKASMELDKALAVINLAEGNSALDPAGELDAIFAVIGDQVRKGKEDLDEATVEAMRTETAKPSVNVQGTSENRAFLEAYSDFHHFVGEIKKIDSSKGEADNEAVQNLIAERDEAADRVFASPCNTHRELLWKFKVAEAMARDADDVIPHRNRFPEIIASLHLDVANLIVKWARL